MARSNVVRQWFNRLVYMAGVAFTPQGSCPIPSGQSGYWLDQGGRVKLRGTDGTDSTLATSGATVFLAKFKTATALPACTYANGTAGVGATLTANANGALGTVGGGTPAADDILLVDSQVSGLQNGLWKVDRAGSVSTTWKVTRLPEFNEAAEMKQGSIVIVQSGTYANRLYLHTTSGAIVPMKTMEYFCSSLRPSHSMESGIQASEGSGRMIEMIGSTIVRERWQWPTACVYGSIFSMDSADSRCAYSLAATPVNTPVRLPRSDAGEYPARSRPSQTVSRISRCCGSIHTASRGEMPKNSGSNPSMPSRNPPKRV